MLLTELAPLVDGPLFDPCHVAFLQLKFGSLNDGVLSGVVVSHGVVGSTLTKIWNGVMPFSPNLGPLVFLSYISGTISSIFSTS
jgi:hypothetical protein